MDWSITDYVYLSVCTSLTLSCSCLLFLILFWLIVRTRAGGVKSSQGGVESPVEHSELLELLLAAIWHDIVITALPPVKCPFH